MKTKCTQHKWVQPRLEDSIDKERKIHPIYCQYCYKFKIDLKDLKTKTIKI